MNRKLQVASPAGNGKGALVMTAVGVRSSDPGRVSFADSIVWVEMWDSDLQSANPLAFPGYAAPASGSESVRTGLIHIAGVDVACVHVDFSRSAGTMGVVAGERVARAYVRATRRGLPVVQLVASGGARLQEGMFSLIQMGRAASAMGRHSAAGLLTLAILRSPTTGGVYASFVSLADLRAAERGAVIGFGGPRVVAQVTGEKPDATSHSAEAAYNHGLVDTLLSPGDELEWLRVALGASSNLVLMLPSGRPNRPDPSTVPSDTWLLVNRCRSLQRPSGLEWAAWLTASWTEIKGSDPSIRAGLANIGDHRAVVIALDRHANEPGHTLPGPKAFRLAQRAISLADRLSLPVVTIVDTPGADPSPSSETEGIASEIAKTLQSMAGLRTVSVCIVVGEGGSGGAMALAHTDSLLMLEGAFFSVISPESGASVLYRDATLAPQLAKNFQMTASHLTAAGIADQVVAEDRQSVSSALRNALSHGRIGDRDRRPDAVLRHAIVEHS